MRKEILLQVQKIFCFSDAEMVYVKRRLENMSRKELKQLKQNLLYFNIDAFLDLL